MRIQVEEQVVDHPKFLKFTKTFVDWEDRRENKILEEWTEQWSLINLDQPMCSPDDAHTSVWLMHKVV